MQPIRILIAALAAAALAAAETEPAPATLYPANGGTPIEAQVKFVTLKTISMVMGSGPSIASVEKSYRDFSRIEYGKSSDLDWLKGQNDLGKNDLEKALEDFRKAATTSKWQPLREQSLLNAAQAAVKLKKWDDALALIADLEKAYPESIHLPQATSLRGEAAQGKGDAAAASAAYKKLVESAGPWGPEALVLGIKGQAAVARAGGKPADAAAILAKPLGTAIKPDTDGYGELGLLLAEDLIASGKKPEALAQYEKIVYAPIDAAQQAAAHLGAAKLTAETATTADQLAAAFDHACLAAVLRGADPKTANAGRTLARDLVAKMHGLAEKDPKLKETIDKEYQVYLGNLQ